MNLASLNPREVATARHHLLDNLNGFATLLLVFLFQYPPEMQAAIDMIADGTVLFIDFFRDPDRTGIDWTARKTILQRVSFLDDLMNSYKYSMPDLPPFGEGKSKESQHLEKRLIDDSEIIGAVLSACRSDSADPDIKKLAYNPVIIARRWDAFAERLQGLQCTHCLQCTQCPALLQQTFLSGLDELETLPLLDIRATSALKLARIVHILDAQKQTKAFRRAFRIILSTSNLKLIRKAVFSLKRLDPNRSSICLWHVINDTIERGTRKVYKHTIKAISELIGYKRSVVKAWYRSGVLQKHPISWAEKEYGEQHLLKKLK